MQLKTLLVAALLPLGLMANPIAEAEPEMELAGEALDTRAISRPQYCQIVGGSSKVNCRANPYTSSHVVAQVRLGKTYTFWCVKKGTCVTINGATNCGWHYVREHKCFVNGHYTDGRCTAGRMGYCGGDDDNDMADPF